MKNKKKKRSYHWREGKRRNKPECEYGTLPDGVKMFTGSGEISRLFRNSIIGGDSPFGKL